MMEIRKRVPVRVLWSHQAVIVVKLQYLMLLQMKVNIFYVVICFIHLKNSSIFFLNLCHLGVEMSTTSIM